MLLRQNTSFEEISSSYPVLVKIFIDIYLEGIFLKQEHVKVSQGEVVQEFLPRAEGS